jgi:hypothetical protein
MAMPDSKVVNFETPHSKHKEEPTQVEDRIADAIRSTTARHLSELTQRLAAVIDDELFKLSDKADNSALQTLYFDAMRHVRLEWNGAQTNYLRQVARQVDDFWKKRPHSAGTGPKDGPGETSLSLVENEELEEELAITSMAEKGNALFHRELFALNKRFAALIRREGLESRDNPLGPQALCRGFATALRPLELELTVKLLIYKLFERVVLNASGKLYQDLNGFLANEGILPTLANTLRHSPQPGHARVGIPARHYGQDDGEENHHAYLEVFQGLQGLLDGWRSQLGLPQPYADTFQGAPVVATAEVVNALSVLQHPALRNSGDPVVADGVKLYVKDQLRKLEADDTPRPLARLEEDIIDMVTLIFDYILDDRNLPDPVKALIARLQIPVVKVAILEKSFFAKKNHPVRLLLNSLSHAGIGLDMADGGTDGPVFKKIENIVNRVLDEFDQNLDLFSELLDDFMAFMEKEAHRSQMVEERTRQVTQSKEQLHLAKRKIAYEIAARLQGKPVPAVVRSFLYNTWKDVLVLAYLRRDKESDDWENALGIVDRLIRSVTPVTDAASRKELVVSIPPLLKAIRTGLEAISWSPQQVATTLKELETCQVRQLSQAAAPEQVGAPVAEETRGIEIRDPELAEAIIEIKANLPDIKNFTADDLHEAPEGADTAGEGLAKVRELDIGEWIEFIDEGKKRMRAKLSWKSQVTATCVFVNRKGVKVAEIAAADLARRLNLGTARIIEGSGVPLMDRALGALMNTLRNPGEKKAPAV